MKHIKVGLVIVVFASTIFLTVSTSSAITRRTDVADSEYKDYAISDFGFSGKFIGPWLGSGTLISPNWTLTAKHVVNSNESFTFYTADGTSRRVVETIMHPTLDLALARLDSDILNVTPAKLYSLDHGADYARECFIAGAGMTGTGITGQQNGTQGDCRAAQQYALYHGDRWGGMWTKDMILTKFRNPSSGGQPMEGGCAQGDSGGGMFLEENGEYCLAGTMSLVWQNSGTYGAYDTSGGAYINTAPYNDWILSYATNAVMIPEPASILLLLSSFTMLLLRRKTKVS